MTIHINTFVKRQTPESEFSHFNPDTSGDPWEFLKNMLYGIIGVDLLKCGVSMDSDLCLTEDLLVGCANIKRGYREGVVLVNVPLDSEDDHPWFYSGVAVLEEGAELRGSFKARRPGESPRKSVGVVGASKMPAKSAFVVLYASTVLAEGDDNELEAVEGNWEVISINANPCDDEMPISPMVLMHNHFGSDGGTDTNMNDEEFVNALREAFLFWKDKAMVLPQE